MVYFFDVLGLNNFMMLSTFVWSFVAEKSLYCTSE